ncbi:hypothetical protein [Blastopirellula marina]|uniref:Uncharacterized protein n=1 Tax=Blastopirellula marina DSM 3645 TaxID=314230 RepID=A3ZU03_9BACT|nr:hypothetical protein [Blastopirellula marina]EAQ80065.1 hypothetical protein DSM3645_05565 [Blastopirellula marina DSM 3645]
MAKKAAASKGNKANAIRKYKTENPSAGPSAISDALKKQMPGVTPQYVSTILSMDKRKSGATKTGALTVDDLLKTKEFVEQIGSISRAKEALEKLAKLS